MDKTWTRLNRTKVQPKYTINCTVDSSPCSNSAKDVIAMDQTAIANLH